MRDTGGGTMMNRELETPTVSCLRCGATYPEGAVVCFRCGAPIGDTSSPTQPVHLSKAIPPAPASPAAAAIEPSDHIEQDKVPTQPRLRAQRALAVKQRPSTPAERWEARGRGVFTLFLTLLLAAAVIGTVMGARALLAGPPVAHQTIYQDPQHRFRFRRQVLWNVTPATDGVLLTDSTGTSTLRVTVSPPAKNETAESRANTIANAQNLGIDAPQSFAGAEWQLAVGDVTGRDGVVRQVEDYVAEHASQLYVIELTSPIASFDGINNLVYQPLLSSFEFA